MYFILILTMRAHAFAFVTLTAIIATLALEINLEDVYRKAETEINSEMMAQMKAGMRSSRFNRRKVTAE